MNQAEKMEILQRMLRIRCVEEKISEEYPKGEMRCPVHLSIGQELVPAIFSQFVSRADYAVSTHRGHAHYLAKGGDLKKMIAEIYGKATGCSSGKGGSMHLIDLDVNFMGTSAIVGNSIPVGVGLGLAIKLKNTNGTSCVFLGDGALEEGVFYESVNFAAVKKLPVIFICENNLYSVYSSLKDRQPHDRDISKLVEAIGVASIKADTRNVEASYAAMKRGFEIVREEKTPVFLEFLTYRWREHCGPNFDDHLGYRPVDEVAGWKRRDPLHLLEEELIGDEDCEARIRLLRSYIAEEVENAFLFAGNSPYPNVSEVFTDIFSVEGV